MQCRQYWDAADGKDVMRRSGTCRVNFARGLSHPDSMRLRPESVRHRLASGGGVM